MIATTAITTNEDIIDSREVIERIAWLELDTDEDDQEELTALLDLQEQAEGYSDWPHGATLIRDTYFESYAQELAEDIGALNDTDQWPNYCIDWERAARELQYDYTSVEFDGVTYWIR